jgi:hypothetical protein
MSTQSSVYEGLRLTYTSPRLNRKNYVDWAAKTENLLDIQGVWAIVNGEDKEPNDKAPEETSRVWRRGNGIAIAILGNSIEEAEFRAIRSIRNAAEAWRKLRNIHRPDGDQAYYRVMTRIMRLRADTGVTIQEASQRLEDLWSELENA